jgi:aspartyl-tRNA(Asn)/glutamyl-tRNA(Gln) amidotransferase subunit C
MPLNADEVRHIARLARLGLTDADVEKFQHQLSAILDYFQQLAAADTEGVPPMAYPLVLQNVMRDDEAGPSSNPEEVLRNAPNREGGFFRVRAVLEE